jgi:hypothetical protein
MTQATVSPLGSDDGPGPALESSSPHSAPAAFLEALDHLGRLGLTQLRLLGGEPTRHPDFLWMLTRALERGFSVLVSSAALLPHALVKRLERLSPDQVTLLLPVVLPGEVWPHQILQQQQLFSRLGPRVVPGINLLFPSVKLDYVLEWIDLYGLARRVRLELRPSFDDDPARLIGEMARRAVTRGVRLELEDDGGPSLDLLPDGKVILTARSPAAHGAPSAAGSRSCRGSASAR